MSCPRVLTRCATTDSGHPRIAACSTRFRSASRRIDPPLSSKSRASQSATIPALPRSPYPVLNAHKACSSSSVGFPARTARLHDRPTPPHTLHRSRRARRADLQSSRHSAGTALVCTTGHPGPCPGGLHDSAPVLSTQRRATAPLRRQFPQPSASSSGRPHRIKRQTLGPTVQSNRAFASAARRKNS